MIMCSFFSQPLVSIIIPSGRPKKVLLTIEALLAQQCDSNIYEILLVTPFAKEAKQIVSEYVRIIQVKKLYAPGRMRNIGAYEAQADFLAFIDDDCVPSVLWLSSLLKRLEESKNIGAVGCRVVCGELTLMNRCADQCLFAAYQHKENTIIALGSAALMVRREAFQEADGFDEHLLASEDWDFSLKLQENGWDCFFDSKVEVLHYHGRGSIFSILKNAYLSGFRSGLVVQKRHFMSLSWLARLSVLLGKTWLYWLLIIPYSVALTLAQGFDNFRNDLSAAKFLPMVFMSRILYHFGVWASLFQSNSNVRRIVF